MYQMHGTSLLSTQLPLWPSIITLGKKIDDEKTLFLKQFGFSSKMDFEFNRINLQKKGLPAISVHCNPLQGSTGEYRENPVMKTGTLQ